MSGTETPREHQRYAGAKWIAHWRACFPHLQRTDISPLGRDVAEILGWVWRGIYHIQNAVTHPRVEWDNPRVIRIVVHDELATIDATLLLDLVLAALRMNVRLSVTGKANGYVELTFARDTENVRYFGTRYTPETAAQRLPDYLVPGCGREDA